MDATITNVSDMDKSKAIIQTLFTLCAGQGKTTINAEAFKRSVQSRLDKEAKTTLELLEGFDEFTIDVKLEIIEECADIIETPVRPTLSSIVDDFSNDGFFEVSSIYSENDLKKKIKYCKNPLEKRRLQKELDALRFENGKHRYGRKRGKKQ